jgi:hypothetical protein
VFAATVPGTGGVGGMLAACPGITLYSAPFSLTSVGVEISVTVGVPTIVSGNYGNSCSKLVCVDAGSTVSINRFDGNVLASSLGSVAIADRSRSIATGS